MELNKRSLDNLKGVDDRLAQVFKEAIKLFDDNFYFIITEGLRTKERQKQLFNEGKSRTLNSYHLTGHAVDIAIFKNKKLTWDELEYDKAAVIIKKAASDLGYKIEWGGDWKWKDRPHWQIKRL